MKFINTPWAKCSLLIIKAGGTDSCHFEGFKGICHRAISESSSVVAMPHSFFLHTQYIYYYYCCTSPHDQPGGQDS